jgi:glutamate/tyrosine decarboxylase-like PLP-dependent enzyme
MTDWDDLLDKTRALALDYLVSLEDRPVWARASYGEMVERLGGPLPGEPVAPAEVVADLARRADPGLTAGTSGRFYGFVQGGTLPAALAADWLTAAWDQNAGLSALSPAGSAAETVVAGWLLDLLGLPARASVGFVTGGMMANFTGLGAARHGVLARAGWDVEQRGLVGAPPVRVLVSGAQHDTVEVAVRYLGLGRDAITAMAVDDQNRVRPDALADALSAGHGPAIVCLQAGDVHTGAFDPFPEAIAAAHDHEAWVHVDGAFGLWAGASPATRHLVEGMAAADSWATDAHKTLNVPYDSGIAVVADRSAHRAAFGATDAAYLITSDVGDPKDVVPEFSRRARGFALWAALRSLGRSGVAALVERLGANARRVADGVAAIPGAQVLNDVVFTQVLVAFGDDDTTRRIGRQVLEDGTFVATPSTWRGRAVLRMSMSNWSTGEAEVDRSLATLRRLATPT